MKAPQSIGLAMLALAASWLAPAAAQQNAIADAARPPAQVVHSGTWSMTLPLGLPAAGAYIPDANAMNDNTVALGKLLYFDPRLSKHRTLSCASCHMPSHGFADPSRTAHGVDGQVGARNSATVLNRLFSKAQFWDGRAADLEEQA